MRNFLEQIDKSRVYLPPVNAGELKYFAAFIMLIDHMACVFLEGAYTMDGNSLMYSLPQGELADRLLRAAGRQAFPIFCFLLVEGFMKTRSRLQYFLRLLFFAALAQIPFQKSIFPRTKLFHGNVLFTLAIGILTIWVIEAMMQAFSKKEGDDTEEGVSRAQALKAAETGRAEAPFSQTAKSSVNFFYAGVFFLMSCGSVYGFSKLAVLLRTDYSYGGVVLIVLMYFLQSFRIPALLISWAWLSWYNSLELYSAPAFFLLACYNGQRGKQHKYFFYFFYPAHLLILWLVRRHFFGI